MTPARSVSALHCQAAADIWRETGSPAQQKFVPTLESWAANFRARAGAPEINEQLEMEI